MVQGVEAVRAAAQSPARVQHDFAAHSVCTAVLRLALRNCLPVPVTAAVQARAGADGGARVGLSPYRRLGDGRPDVTVGVLLIAQTFPAF